MLPGKLIFIAILSIVWFLPQRSIAQSEMCAMDPQYGNVGCQGGKRLYGLYRLAPKIRELR